MSPLKKTRAVAIYERAAAGDEMARAAAQERALTISRVIDLEAAGQASIRLYLDLNISGNLPLAERPQGMLLLADLAAGRRTEVRLYRPDRLARNLMCYLDALVEFERLGVAVRFLEEPLAPHQFTRHDLGCIWKRTPVTRREARPS